MTLPLYVIPNAVRDLTQTKTIYEQLAKRILQLFISLRPVGKLTRKWRDSSVAMLLRDDVQQNVVRAKPRDRTKDKINQLTIEKLFLYGKSLRLLVLSIGKWKDSSVTPFLRNDRREQRCVHNAVKGLVKAKAIFK